MTRIIPIMLGICFFISGCQLKLTTMPSAENMRMTEDGRLFATGSQGVYEIKKVGEEYTRVRLNEEACQHNGLAIMNGWVYTVCAKSYPTFTLVPPFINWADASLWAYPLNEDPATAKLKYVDKLDGYIIPNGIDALPETNEILVADETFIAIGSVSLYKIEMQNNEPVGFSETRSKWLSKEQGVTDANGVRVIGQSVFLTDLGTIKRVDLDANRNPIATTVIYSEATILDDLAPFCDGVVATDFIRGQLVYVNADGAKSQVIQKGLFFPTAVMMDASPLLDGDNYLVSQLGMFFEPDDETARGKILYYSKDAMGLSCDSIGEDISPPEQDI